MLHLESIFKFSLCSLSDRTSPISLPQTLCVPLKYHISPISLTFECATKITHITHVTEIDPSFDYASDIPHISQITDLNFICAS